MRLLQKILFFVLFSIPQLSAGAVKFEQYILAPTSRELKPRAIFGVNGNVTDPKNLLESSDSGSGTRISGANSSVTYDFERNVGGRITLNIGTVSSVGEVLGLTYSESSMWVRSNQSDGVGRTINDFPFTFKLTKPGNFTVPQEFLRGAFKYLTITLQTAGSVKISNVQLNFTAMPHFQDMRAYTGYFHSDDELLNRIWYAGAYTNQLCTISPSEGDSLRQIGFVPPGQSPSPPGFTLLNVTIANGTSVVTDGAKRDRLVWPGDYSVAFPAIAVSTYDIISVTNGLDNVFSEQNAAGQLPYAGFPMTLPPATFSFTYHLYSLIGVSNVFLWSGDVEYLQGKWDSWKRAMAWSLGTIDETGLMNVTSSADWLRFGLGAHAIEPNAILYNTLGLGLTLASVLNDTSVVDDYTNNRTVIKAAANALLWDPNVGIIQNSSQALSISGALQKRWTPFGATAAGNATSPFIAAFELDAHMSVNNTDAGLKLIRTQWGFMMDDPRMTNSTFIEGYSADGILHYPPYSNDAQISYTHGWATGPTFTLTTYVAGIRITGPAGKTWMIRPQPGNLTAVEAGFSTVLGNFSVAWNVTDTTFSLNFSTPKGTSGTVVLPTFETQNKTLLHFTIKRLDGEKHLSTASSRLQDESSAGVDGLTGGDYVVTAKYA